MSDELEALSKGLVALELAIAALNLSNQKVIALRAENNELRKELAACKQQPV